MAHVTASSIIEPGVYFICKESDEVIPGDPLYLTTVTEYNMVEGLPLHNDDKLKYQKVRVTHPFHNLTYLELIIQLVGGPV